MTATVDIIPVGGELPPTRISVAAPEGGRSPARERRGRGGGAGRFRCLNDFVDSGMVGLSRAEIACWLILFRDERNGRTRTGQTDLARRAGCDRSSVVRAIAGLRDRGLVEVVRRGGIGSGPNVYRVRPPIQEPG